MGGLGKHLSGMDEELIEAGVHPVLTEGKVRGGMGTVKTSKSIKRPINPPPGPKPKK